MEVHSPSQWSKFNKSNRPVAYTQHIHSRVAAYLHMSWVTHVLHCHVNKYHSCVFVLLFHAWGGWAIYNTQTSTMWYHTCDHREELLLTVQSRIISRISIGVGMARPRALSTDRATWHLISYTHVSLIISNNTCIFQTVTYHSILLLTPHQYLHYNFSKSG